MRSTGNGTKEFRLVVVSAGAGDPSSTRLLTDRIAGRTAARAAARGHRVVVDTVELRELTAEITTALVSQLLGPKLTAAVELLSRADGIVVGTPVYKAAPSGLFSAFFQVLDNDLLIGRPVVLSATAGTARHALVVDNDLRALFAYLRTLTAPTSVFATADDWASGELPTRIDRAAFELLTMMESGFADTIRNDSWQHYQHEYGSAGGTELDIDLDTDMMRLATGGAAG